MKPTDLVRPPPPPVIDEGKDPGREESSLATRGSGRIQQRPGSEVWTWVRVQLHLGKARVDSGDAYPRFLFCSTWGQGRLRLQRFSACIVHTRPYMTGVPDPSPSGVRDSTSWETIKISASKHINCHCQRDNVTLKSLVLVQFNCPIS